jgi:copper chaperone CopZ
MDITLKVKGMHCKSCEAMIAENLMDMPGVQEASASEKSQAVTIRFDPSKVKELDLRKAIKEAGYEVR